MFGFWRWVRPGQAGARPQPAKLKLKLQGNFHRIGRVFGGPVWAGSRGEDGLRLLGPTTLLTLDVASGPALAPITIPNCYLPR